MRRLLPLALAANVLAVACASPPVEDGDRDACDELAARIEGCGGKVGAGFGDQCRGTRADEVSGLAAASCTTLAGIDTSGWQAATPGQTSQALSETKENGLCAFTWQCAGDLVCRPTMSFVNRCLKRGTLGEHCWTDGQCARGLSCHWIWHDIAPAPHPGRVCNPHGEEPHPHTPSDVGRGGGA